jgi:hypothetical protein
MVAVELRSGCPVRAHHGQAAAIVSETDGVLFRWSKTNGVPGRPPLLEIPCVRVIRRLICPVRCGRAPPRTPADRLDAWMRRREPT